MGYLKLEVKILKENYVFLLIGLFAAIVGDILVSLSYFELHLVMFDSTKGSKHLVKELGSFGEIEAAKTNWKRGQTYLGKGGKAAPAVH